MAERWTGRRLKEDEIRSRSGVERVLPVERFSAVFHAAAGRGRTVVLDLWKKSPEDPDTEAFRFAARVGRDYPWLRIENCHRQLCVQRTIKSPEEIAAMRKAEEITRAGIEAMMRASRPGLYEYQYKAVFDHALADRGVLTPAFPSIIAAGKQFLHPLLQLHRPGPGRRPGPQQRGRGLGRHVYRRVPQLALQRDLLPQTTGPL